MAPLPPPHSLRPSSSSSASSTCSSSSSSSPSGATALECALEGSCKRPLDLRINGGVLQIVQARGLPPLPSALHGLLRGHGQAVAVRLAELQQAAEQALAKTQAALERAASSAARAWLQLPGNMHALQKQRGRIARRNSSFLRAHNFAAIIPGDSVAEIVVTSSIFNFLNIYNTLLITRLVLTWFPNPPEVIANPLSTICDPYLNIFRGIIPPLGGTLDLSPILAFLVLNVFTNTASALPAEMPKDATALCTTSQTTDKPATEPTWRQRAQLRKAGIVRKQVIAANKEDR